MICAPSLESPTRIPNKLVDARSTCHDPRSHMHQKKCTVRLCSSVAGAHDPPRAPVDRLQLIPRDVCASMVMGAVETRQNLIWHADVEPVVGEQASLRDPDQRQ